MLTTCDICGDLCNYNSDHPGCCDECAFEMRYLERMDSDDVVDDFDDDVFDDNNYYANDGTEGGG